MKKVLFVVSTAFIILMLAHVFRYQSGVFLLGDDSFYHARMAEGIIAGQPVDTLSFGGRPYLLDIYEYALAGSGTLLGIELASMILPLLLGLVSSVLFYHVLGRFGISDRDRLIASLAWVTSPIFVFLFAASNHLSLVIFLLLAGSALFMGKGWAAWLSVLPFASIGFFGLIHSLVAIACIIVLAVKQGRRSAAVHAAVLLLTSLVYTFSGHARYLPVISPGSLEQAFSVFGSEAGLSIVMLFLAIAGMRPTWQYRRNYLHPLIFLLVLYLFTGLEILVYANLIICTLASFGFVSLFEGRWELLMIRKMTVFVIGLGLLFLTVSYMHDLAKSGPSEDFRQAMQWLKENGKSGEKVLSAQEYGFMIEYYARLPVVWDEQVAGVPGIAEIQADINSAFRNRSLQTTESVLSKYRVRYIVTDSGMDSLLRNEKQQPGLPFIMENSENFRKVEEFGDVQVWRFID